MKWLLVLLVSVNIILFAVQIKEQVGVDVVPEYKSVEGVKRLSLLAEQNKRVRERCVVVGAFPDSEALAAVKLFLNDSDVKYELIEKREELAPAYWVYVVDDINDKLLESLTKMGIESYSVSSGDLKGKLSTGLFVNIDLARNMIAALKKNGIAADYVEKKKVKTTQWLSFNINDHGSDDGIMRHLKEMPINLGEIKEFFCKSIASEK